MNRNRLLVACVLAVLVVAGVTAGVTVLGPRLDLPRETAPTGATPTHTDAGDDGHADAGHVGDHTDGQGEMEMDMDMRMVENGTVVNENAADLPPGCDELAGERNVTVVGGVSHSEAGEMYAFERDRLELEPCTAVTVTFVNEDTVRHQWMVHGLPAETYPMGMFTIEVNGPGAVTATFVTPGDDVTLDTHCSLPQHEQKGMAMTVVVGEGGDSGGHDHDDGDGADNHQH